MSHKIVVYDNIIIGGGVTGFASAMYAARLGLRTLVIAETIGGTISYAHNVQNYPGFGSISGFELAEKIRSHAMEYPVELEEDRAVKIERAGKNLFIVHTMNRKTFHSKTIIFATGTKFRELNAVNERRFFNKGVHYCALCDGGFYKGKIVAVVGGADTACTDALLLTQYAKKVYVIYRGEKLRPEPITYKGVMKNKKIEIIYRTNVTEFYGNDERIEGIVLDNPHNGSNRLEVDGVFVAIGHIVLSEIAKELGVHTNEKGEIVINKNAETNVPGFFAAGDVTNSVFKQAIIGVAEGVMASYSAYRYITHQWVEE